MNKIAKALLIAIIAIIGITIIVKTTNPTDTPNKYANEAIRVLEKYKDFEIDAKEAANRLGNLMDEIRAEEAKTDSKKEKSKLSGLWLDMLSIYTDLRHHGTATGYEVDEAIKAIKNAK